MKQSRFLPMVALAVAIALSAFTMPEQKTTEDPLWYDFVGSDVNNPEHYFLRGDGSSAPSCNAQTSIRCAVQAMPNETLGEDYPDLNDPAKVIRNKTQE